MRSPVGIKEEPAVISPTTTVAVTGTVEAPLQTLKKGPWTAIEDAILIDYVRKNGEGNWNAVQKNIGLQRCGKSCRLRWANHLRPNLKKGSFTPEEEALILRLHSQIGNKWARMATHLPGRTDNEIKNYWNTRIKRRQRAGLPLYPPEIQLLHLNNAKQNKGPFMHHQNQLRQKNFIPHISPTTNSNQINNIETNNGSANYALDNFNYSQPSRQHQSPIFSVKMELPSTQLFTGCADSQKLPPPPMAPMTGQGNSVHFDDLFQDSQGSGEIFNEGLFFEPLSGDCAAMTDPSFPPLPSNYKHTVIDPLYKLGNPDISFGIPIMKQPVETMASQDVYNMAELNPIHTKMMPVHLKMTAVEKFLYDLDLSDDLRVEMKQVASSLSIGHDRSFGTSSWENMPSIH